MLYAAAMRAHPLLTTILVATLAACGTGNGASSGAETPTPPAPSPEPPRPAPRAPAPALPSPTACQLDTDCTVAVSAPDGDDLCCDTTVTAQPITTAYLQAVTRWRATACVAATCPPQHLPGAQLAPCGYEPRCIAGGCNNACSQPARPPTDHGNGAPS